MRRLLVGVNRRVPRMVLEIGAGVLIGPSVLGWMGSTTGVHHVADAGAALLLFMVGMHVDVAGLRRSGRSASRVALIGMAVPVVSGYAVGILLGEGPHAALFLGAALCATSIGITARVFRDAGRLDSTEAHVVIGAAVIDDVLGLVLLAVVTSVTSSGGFDTETAMSSAVIIGSFFAGVVVARAGFAGRVERTASLAGMVLVPFFFVHIGLTADVTALSSPSTLAVAVSVLAVAMATKLVAGWGAGRGPIDRVAIGLAMAPRGEVGLIFASTAVTTGAFGARLYAVVVLVVLGTTVLTPVLLRRRLGA